MSLSLFSELRQQSALFSIHSDESCGREQRGAGVVRGCGNPAAAFKLRGVVRTPPLEQESVRETLVIGSKAVMRFCDSFAKNKGPIEFWHLNETI
jgi:hypothetical protein